MRLSSQTLWSVVVSVVLLGTVPSVAYIPIIPSPNAPTAVMQVDLLFPRDDQVYTPTPYMPIVFSVQNPRLARHTYPSMLVRFHNHSDPNERGGMSYYTQHLNVTDWASNETFFAYTLVDTFAHEGNWSITWHLSWASCKIDDGHEGAFLGLIERNCTCERLSRASFITRNGGQALDLVASTAAAATANETACAGGVAINVSEETMPLDTLWQPDWVPLSDDTCVIASQTTSSARNACGVRIDPALAANITADARARVCAAVHPPSDCKSAARRSATVGVGVGVGCGLAAVLGGLGLFLA